MLIPLFAGWDKLDRHRAFKFCQKKTLSVEEDRAKV